MNAHQALEEAAAHRWALRFAEADAVLAPWVEVVRQHPADDLELTFRVLTAQAYTFSCLGREDDALALSTACLALAQQHAEAVREDEALVFGMVKQFSQWASSAMKTMSASPEAALRVLEAGADFVRLCGRPTWQAEIWRQRASVLLDCGRVAEGLAAWEQAIALKAIDHDSPGASWMSMRRSYASALIEAGRKEEGVQRLGDLLAEGARGLDALACHCYRGHGLLDLGRYREAAEDADRAMALASAMSPEQELSALGLAVEAYLYTGRMADGAAAAQRILELARRSGQASDLCSAWQDTADVALWSLDVEAAAAAIEQMARYAVKVDGYYGTDERAQLLAERRQRLEWLRQGDVTAVRTPVRGAQ